MKIRNTKAPAEVEALHRWSMAQVQSGLVEEVLDWDAGSPHYNSLFRDLSTGQEWIVYLADHAYSGEIRLVAAAPSQPNNSFKPNPLRGSA